MASTATSSDPLTRYRDKRRFDETPEPKGRRSRKRGYSYSIQKHHATRLHYDLRLELDGVLKSWAITRGPSLDPSEKRLAVRTEDHPVDYATFEGPIPSGNYGAGTVLLWDEGQWEPIGDPEKGLKTGKLEFYLKGQRLRGAWALVRFKGQDAGKRENWLLIKQDDDAADRDGNVIETYKSSVATGREVDEIARAHDADRSDDHERKAKNRKKSDGSKVRRKRRLPEFTRPALATLVDELPSGENWIFEVKFDGYRALSAVSGDNVAIYTRSGLDWTEKFAVVADALAKLELDGALLDGEVVAIDTKGKADFSTLQRALKKGGKGLAYFVFDLLEVGGKSLRNKLLSERKQRLRELLADAGRNGPVFFTDHIHEDGDRMREALCDKGYEGIIAKRIDAKYRSGRGRSWLKVKCGRDQEFVIIGWSPSDKDRPFASLLLATHEGGELRYAGRVGTGFSEDEMDALIEKMRKLERKTPPISGDIPRSVGREAHWVRAELVANIGFAEFTSEGYVRHGRYLGLRQDKPAKEVRIEKPGDSEETAEMSDSHKSATASFRGIQLTHPDRVLYPEQGVTKRDLAAYLDKAADAMLPFIADRPISLVRCPQGQGEKCFFQRHGGSGLPDAFKTVSIREKDGDQGDYLYIANAKGLIAAAQMGVLELHIWGARRDRIEKPDRVVFDLDPDASVSFATVKDAAMRLRDVLGALELRTFPLVTGGKGIHVVAPLTRRTEWPTVKAFAEAVSNRIVEDDPDNFIATMSKARRKGRIFIDYFRNERGASAIAPFSPRARKGAPVAWPVSWDELASVRAADQFSLSDADPDAATGWRGYGDIRQSITVAALDALGLGDDE